MNGIASQLYRGIVVHQRLRPKRHRLQYRVFSLLLDIDELSTLGQRLRLFAYNRRGVLSFYDRDHGDGSGAPLRPWVEENLKTAGIDIAGGRIEILCYPRLWGYVFNPLSVYYCYHRGGALAAMIYEVNNTLGERHSYLIPVKGVQRGEVHQHCEKVFYVSPFIPMQAHYRFRVSLPGDRLSVVINQSDADGPLLHAAFTARRVAVSDMSLLQVILAYPLMTLKVIVAIHWEALRLWLKGVPLVRRPAAAPAPVTIVAATKGMP